MSDFEGQSRIEVLTKACLAACMLPAIDELEELGMGAPIEATDKVMANFVRRLAMLGFHLDPHFEDAEIVHNIEMVLELFAEEQKPDPKESVH